MISTQAQEDLQNRANHIHKDYGTIHGRTYLENGGIVLSEAFDYDEIERDLGLTEENPIEFQKRALASIISDTSAALIKILQWSCTPTYRQSKPDPKVVGAKIWLCSICCDRSSPLLVASLRSRKQSDMAKQQLANGCSRSRMRSTVTSRLAKSSLPEMPALEPSGLLWLQVSTARRTARTPTLIHAGVSGASLDELSKANRVS
jgi:hypothetical protein